MIPAITGISITLYIAPLSLSITHIAPMLIVIITIAVWYVNSLLMFVLFILKKVMYEKVYIVFVSIFFL